MKNTQKKNLLYSGKAKDIYATDDANFVIQHFKDNMTAGNGAKNELIFNKGIVNCKISSILMQKLAKFGVKNHFLDQLNDRDQLVKSVKIIPLEVIVRNIASGSFCKKFGTKNGFKFKSPCVEFSYKDDSLGDPAISEGQILALEIINQGQIDLIKNIALEVNKILKDEFAKMELNLVDFKIEFGFDKNDNKNGEIILADEITPDSCRLWNVDGKSFDKDVFRKDLGDVMIGYEYILGKLEA